MRFSLTSAFASDITLGTREGADSGFDRMDASEPPTLSKTVSAYFDHSDWGNRSGHYGRDYQPIMESGEERIWQLVVFTDRRNVKMNLAWEESIQQIPGDVCLYPQG